MDIEAKHQINKVNRMVEMPFWKQKEFWVFIPIYFFVSFIELTLKLETVYGIWFNGRLATIHRHLLGFEYYNNEQSRLLQWVIPQAIRDITHISIPQAYMVQRFAFVFLAFLAFHYYMRKWLSSGESFAGVAFLAAVMPLTYKSDLQESAPLLHAVVCPGSMGDLRRNPSLCILLLSDRWQHHQ